MKKLQLFFEKALMVAIAVFLWVPLVLGIVLHFKKHVPPWAQGDTTGGVQIKQTPVPFSASTLFHAKYQAWLATEFDENFACRRLLIKTSNEIYFRLFKASPMPSADVVVERNDSLIEGAYLREYCMERIAREQLAPIVGNIRRLQDECERRGIGFVLLVTPSKASVYPEDIPESWMKRYDPRPRAYDLFIPLLREQGVRFVDGHAIIMQMKAHAPVPVYPKGGIHWGDPAAVAAANAVIAALKEQGKNLHAIDNVRYQNSDIPIGEDIDLLDLSTLLFPWRYPVVQANYSSVAATGNYNMAFVGGSYMWKVGGAMSSSRQFSEIDCFYYYKTAKKVFLDGRLVDISGPIQSIDFDREIFAADCLVLEINEQALPQTLNTLTTFLPDALANLPAPGKPRPPFLSGKLPTH